MKYLVYRMAGNGFTMNAMANLNEPKEIENIKKNGFEIVGYYKTKKEARETIEELGGWIS